MFNLVKLLDTDPGSYTERFNGKGAETNGTVVKFFGQFGSLYFTICTVLLVISVAVLGIILFIKGGDSEVKTRLIRLIIIAVIAYLILDIIGFVALVGGSL